MLLAILIWTCNMKICIYMQCLLQCDYWSNTRRSERGWFQVEYHQRLFILSLLHLIYFYILNSISSTLTANLASGDITSYSENIGYATTTSKEFRKRQVQKELFFFLTLLAIFSTQINLAISSGVCFFMFCFYFLDQRFGPHQTVITRRCVEREFEDLCISSWRSIIQCSY